MLLQHGPMQKLLLWLGVAAAQHFAQPGPQGQPDV